MKYYIKYAQYLYLIVAILFVFDAFTKFRSNQSYWINLLLAFIAILMFMFKRKFAKKFEDQNK